MPDGSNFGGGQPRLPMTRDVADDRSTPAATAPRPAPDAPVWRPERISGWLAGH